MTTLGAALEACWPKQLIALRPDVLVSDSNAVPSAHPWHAVQRSAWDAEEGRPYMTARRRPEKSWNSSPATASVDDARREVGSRDG